MTVNLDVPNAGTASNNTFNRSEMMDANWTTLVARYADGRPLCNCRCAYYTPCGVGIDGQGNYRTDMLACQYGCSANQLMCRGEIAKRVLADLPAVGAA